MSWRPSFSVGMGAWDAPASWLPQFAIACQPLDAITPRLIESPAFG